MGIFDIFKKNKVEKAKPMFYDKPDGGKLGIYAFADGKKTMLPLNPENGFSDSDEEENVVEWRLLLVLSHEGKAIGDCEYFDGISRLEKYIIKKTDENITVRALNPGELYTVITRRSTDGEK